jgi:response regulator RpfG family c-di-GMP phosphodiesterase
VLLAEAMELSEEEVYKIRISALLHDVGKIGVDDRVLKKPGELTTEEFELMKQHPVKGANIIRPVAKLREMLPGIELHHESLNGGGYPYGLKGDEIPLGARIIAVADTLDAMTATAPTRPPWTSKSPSSACAPDARSSTPRSPTPLQGRRARQAPPHSSNDRSVVSKPSFSFVFVSLWLIPSC